MPTLNLIQHHPAEGPGAIAFWAESRGLTLKVFRADLGQLPPVSADPVILLGGPYESMPARPGLRPNGNGSKAVWIWAGPCSPSAWGLSCWR